nr:hypothetical protein CFP56_44790 [Quercus suber]
MFNSGLQIAVSWLTIKGFDPWIFETIIPRSEIPKWFSHQKDFNRFMSQRSNSGMTPYEGINVLEDSFCNSVVAAEGNKAKRSRDDYDGAGPSGEGSSNDIPNPKRIERLTEFMTHGNAGCEDSSEYKECDEELSDWQEPSESDLKG